MLSTFYQFQKGNFIFIEQSEIKQNKLLRVENHNCPLYVFLSSLSQSYAAQCDNHKTIDINSTVKNNLINTILTMLY